MVDSTVRAMTWNIWWRFGPRWRDRQPGIKDTITRFSPDIVALQEVWSSNETTQADELAKSLGMYAVFASPSYPPAPTGTDVSDFDGVEPRHCAAQPLANHRSGHGCDAGTAPQLGSRVARGPCRPSDRPVADHRDVLGLRGALHR